MQKLSFGRCSSLKGRVFISSTIVELNGGLTSGSSLSNNLFVFKKMLIEHIKSTEKGEFISHEEVMVYLDVMEEEVVAYKHAQAL